MNEIIYQQRQFWATGKTKDISFRIKQLKLLKQGIENLEQGIIDALKADLNKAEFEGYLSEINFVQKEIKYALRKIKSWVKPQKASVPPEQMPASAYIYPEPLGVVLIIGPWNYPFSLIIAPLIGAISAGNCAILKPSELAPKTSRIVADLIRQTFDLSYIAVVEGGVETSKQLLAEKFDYIFFTGGTKIGKIVMEAAAKNLTPVTLELGGKSPCIVAADANLNHAAKSITWGKFVNAGQSCIAPDYLLVERQIKKDLVTKIQQYIKQFYGENPATSPDYGRIINKKQFERLVGLLKDSNIITGGQTNARDNYISPTLIDNVSVDAAVMQEEIFGPILPILEYDNLEEVITLINNRPQPLVIYFFSKDKAKQEKVLKSTSSGSVCINDTLVQYTVTELPFGGVGDSGIGSYHGKASFDTFSHYKSVFKKSFRFDINIRYPPYQDKLRKFKKLLNI